MPPKETKIRPAGPDDAAALAACTTAAYAKFVSRLGRHPKPMTLDYRHVVTNHQVWVMEAHCRCIGVLVLMPKADHMLIYSVAVDPGHQGRGHGRKLMALAERESRCQGLGELRLYTNEKMVENIRFYEQIGYEETARRPHSEHSESVLVFMSKDLATA